uniref:Immunoglobulin V-set domain-containing protein n=1 Tax=Xiphophorus couchianus TaxID=32473 RepID=A0A3B5MV00_9TELE
VSRINTVSAEVPVIGRGNETLLHVSSIMNLFTTCVLQVTWQRGLRPESLENMATYNKPVGEQINEPFKGKVILNNSSLSSSSITLKNVMWADENCYVCSFNVYPDGSKRKQICLKVEGELVFLFLRWSLFQNVAKH